MQNIREIASLLAVARNDNNLCYATKHQSYEFGINAAA